jgi:LacI family transcriptional regulator
MVQHGVPTIIDVAEQAGVSRQTVSRVINDSRDVNEETRARMLDSIRDLGYRPNVEAQTLRRGKTRDQSH